jgi:hypothetical protein
MSDVVEATDTANAWIAGFLAGSELDATTMFGVGILDDDDGPRWERWAAALAEYRRSGDWPHERWQHLLPIPTGANLPPYVWMVRGDEVWRWDTDRWTLAVPQPPRTLRLIDGTACAERGTRSMATVSTVHLVCEQCGSASQTLPDDMTDEEFERVQFTYNPTLVHND